MEGTSAIVIYEGNKFFWRKRVTIDVVIVEHNDYDITEVIAYEPTIDREASRIYLDSEILSSKINQEEVAKKMSCAKQHDVPHTIQFVNGVLNRAVADYILNRLSLSEFSVDPKCFSVELLFNFRDRDVESGGDNIDRLIREKPVDLPPHKVFHFKAVVAGEADAAIVALEEEKRSLTEDTTKAEQFEDKTRDPLGFQERWRIPIVLAKVAKNTPLSDGDAKIWSSVASNLSAIDTTTKMAPYFNPSPSPSPKRVTKPPIPTGRDRTPLHRSCPVSPNRSPCPTPRRRSLDQTPDEPLRYMSGTTTSQLRAQSIAELEKPVAKKHIPRSRTVGARAASPKRRKSILIASSASTDVEEAEVSGLTNTSFGGSDDTVSLVGRLAAGLASFSGSLRASFGSKTRGKVHIVDAEEEGMVKLDSQRSFLGIFQSGSSKSSQKRMSLEGTETASSDANDLLSLNDSTPAPLLLREPRFSFKDAVSQFTAEDALDHSISRFSDDSGHTPGGLAAFFSGAGGRRANNSPVGATTSLRLNDSEGDLSQLVGNDLSEITPPRRRHYYFSSLLASFDSNSSSSDKSGGKPAAHVHQKPRQDTHDQPLSRDSIVGQVNGNSTRTTPGNASISAKYHPNASGKSLVSFRDALGDWLRWSTSHSGKSSRVSPASSPLPVVATPSA